MHTVKDDLCKVVRIRAAHRTWGSTPGLSAGSSRPRNAGRMGGVATAQAFAPLRADIRPAMGTVRQRGQLTAGEGLQRYSSTDCVYQRKVRMSPYCAKLECPLGHLTERAVNGM